MTKKKRILRLILIYIFIIETFLVCDIFLYDAAFCRDFMTNFVYKGMDIWDAYRLLGKSLGNVGFGAVVMEYHLPFGNYFYVTSMSSVVGAVKSDSYLFKGFLIPVIVAAVAAVEAGWYALYSRRAKRKAAASRDGCSIAESKNMRSGQLLKKVPHLILVYIFVIETFVLCDLFFFDAVFYRDLIANRVNVEGMRYQDVYHQILGIPNNVDSGEAVKIYSLPFGNQLYLSIKSLRVISVSADRYLFQGILFPVIMAVVAAVEAVWCVLRFRRVASKDSALSNDPNEPLPCNNDTPQ